MNSTRPRIPRPASAIFAPRTPKDARAMTGKLTRDRMAGRVHAYTNGPAAAVPNAVLRPSCHHTSGASVLRFHRTKPKGTESTTAATARQTNTAMDRSYSSGCDATKSSLMASAAPSRASFGVFSLDAWVSAATTASHAGSSSKNETDAGGCGPRGNALCFSTRVMAGRGIEGFERPSAAGSATMDGARALGLAPYPRARHACHARATGAITPVVDTANIVSLGRCRRALIQVDGCASNRRAVREPSFAAVSVARGGRPRT